MVADAWNEIAWIYARVNAGPEVFAPLFSYEEPEDLNSRADLDKKLWEMGVRFRAEHFADNYNLKPSEFSVVDSTASVPGPNFSSSTRRVPIAERAQQTFDAAIENMLPDAVKANAEFVRKIENAVQAATSYDDLQLRLLDLLAPATEPDELERFMRQAMTAAAGFGATAVRGEAVEDN